MTVGYIKTGKPVILPQILGVWSEGKQYRFTLETCHLNDSNMGPGGGKEHVHNVYHIVLYQEGENVFLFKGKPLDVGPGTLVLISPGESHNFAAQKSGKRVYHEITFSLDTVDGSVLDINFPALLSLYTGVEIRCDLERAVFQFDRRQLDWCSICYERLMERIQDPSGINWFFIQHIILDMVSFIIQELFLESSRKHEKSQNPMTHAREYIGRKYMLNESVGEIAHHFGISKEHFCRKFKASFNISPIAYRQQIRINAAKNLLKNTNLLCKEIAERIGYNDLYSFSKAFKNEEGISPIKYREG